MQSSKPLSQPQSATEPPAHYDWKFIIRVGLRHKKALITANIVAILATLFSVPLPLLMPLLVDEVLLDNPGSMLASMNQVLPEGWQTPASYIFFIVLFSLILRITSVILGVVQSRQFTLISKDVIFTIRRGLLSRLKRISMAEYETLGSGAVASHLVTDLDTVDRFVGSSVSKLVVAVLSILGTAIILLWMHWQLALFILFLNPLVIYLTMAIGKRVKRLKSRENHAFELFQESLAETLDAIHQIRAANREEHYLSRLIKHARDVRDHSSRFQWQSDAAMRFSSVVFMAGFDLFRAVAMLMVLYSGLTIGEMMAVFGYLWFMLAPVQEVLTIQYDWFGAKAALSRVNRLLALEQEPQIQGQQNPFNGPSNVRVDLNHISFSYHTGREVLNDVTLTIPAGKKVALVGASGGGKSTLIQLLLGLYPRASGDVLFNGISVNQIGWPTVREHVATVLQHPALFNTSVRDNITLGREFSDEQIWKALVVAQLDQFVAGLSEQLDTIVGKNGVRFSGGQRQRLAIARMVLTDPKVVILDEATSALDTKTESDLHEALEQFLQGRTTIIVAHRLSAVRQADLIYVLENGSVTEQGTHESLLQHEGLYHQLYADQVG